MAVLILNRRVKKVMKKKPNMPKCFFTFFVICFLVWIPQGQTKAASFGVLNSFNEHFEFFEGGYNGSYATSPETLYYFKNTDGGIGVINVLDSSLSIYTFSSNGILENVQTVTLPLPIFGGYYHGNDGYHYIAVGQNNYNESKTLVVCKILKFSPSWTLLGTADIPGGISNAFEGIYEVFRCSQARMALYGHYLICHTGRTMFLSSDGKHHQSDITFIIDTLNMKLLESYQQPYCSHSFAQFVQVKDDTVYFLNHGDAYPRTVYLSVFPNYLESEMYDVRQYSLFSLLGEIGENYTGTTVNGFELGVSGNLITGCSVPHNNAVNGQTGYKNMPKNIYVIITSPDGSTSQFKWLTQYTLDSKISVSEPRLIRVTNDRFVILFNETRGGYDILRYIVLDSQGNILTRRNYLGMDWSGEQPIYNSGKIMWIASADNNQMSWQYIPYTEQSAGVEAETQTLYFTQSQHTADLPRISYNPDTGENIQFTLDSKAAFSVVNGTVYFNGSTANTVNLTFSNGGETLNILCRGLLLKEKVLTLTQNTSQKITISGLLGEKLTYQSENPKIATVDASGTVTGVSGGVTKIDIFVDDVQLNCLVYVKRKQDLQLKNGIILSGFKQISESDGTQLLYYSDGHNLHIEFDFSRAEWNKDCPANGIFDLNIDSSWLTDIPYSNYSFSIDLNFSELGKKDGDYEIGLYLSEFYTTLLTVNWKNGKVFTYAIEDIACEDVKVSSIADCVYNGKKLKPTVKLTYGNKKLKLNRDYTLTYKNNTKVGTATVLIKGCGSFYGKRKATFIIKKAADNSDKNTAEIPGKVKKLKNKKVAKNKVYLQWKISPGAERYAVYGRNYASGAYKLLGTTKQKKYTISKLENIRIQAGKAYQFQVEPQRKIKGKWKSGPKATLTVITQPVTPSIKSLSAGKGSFKLSWKKDFNVNGYQVYISTKKEKGYKKAASVKANVQSTAIKKLKKGTVYYVKVRSYKKAGKVITYSNFSKVQRIKVN